MGVPTGNADPAREAHEIWRRQANGRLPEIAMRVFALREMDYPNRAYQDQIELRLSHVIRILNSDRPQTIIARMSDQALFDEIVRDLEKAEASAVPSVPAIPEPMRMRA